jgi:hypothetical protein
MLGKNERILDIDAEIPDGRLDLGVAKKNLHRSQIARPLVD